MTEQQQQHAPDNSDAEHEGGAGRAAGAAAVATGQAGAVVVIERPAPGESVEIQAARGETYVLDFPADQAEVGVGGDDLYLVFDDDGDGAPDSQIVFVDLVAVAEGADAPVFEIAGEAIDTGLLVEQAVAAAGAEEAPLEEVAAGSTDGGADGGGASEYSDEVGSTIGLLDGSGVITATTLAFGTVDLGEDTPPSILALAGAGDDDTPERINLALVLDASGSMRHDMVFDGRAMTGLEALDATVERMLDELAGGGDEAVRVHMVSFAERMKEAQTFDIVVDGVVDAAALQAAKDFVLQDGDDPLQLAKGGTNYEAGFAAAFDWFTDGDDTLDDPDVNQTILFSEGLPTHAFKDDGDGEVVAADSPQNAANHVLGQALGPGGADGFSEFEALLGSFKGTPGSVDAIGIDPDSDGAIILGQLDDDGMVETVGSSPAPVIMAADLGLDSAAGPVAASAPADAGSAAAAVGLGDEQIIQQLLDGTPLAA